MTSSPSRLRRPLVGLAVLSLAAAGIAHASAAPQVTGPLTTLLTQETVPGLADHAVLGDVAATAPVHLAVTLGSRDPSGLDATFAAMRTKGNPLYGATFSPAQFRAAFGTDPAVAARVRSAVTAHGLDVSWASPDGSYVLLRGTVAQAERTFDVDLKTYAGSAGSTLRAYSGAPTVPAGVTSVLGLTTLDTMKTHQQDTCAAGECIGALHPQDLWSAYDLPDTDRGRGQKVAIFGAGFTDTVLSDLRKFEKEDGLPEVPLRRHLVDDAVKVDDGGLGEWDLDTQASSGMAPDLARLDLYFGTDLSTSSIGGTYSAWVNDDDGPLTGNSSFGGCESLAVALGETTAFDPLMKQAVMEGRTMFVSTGDVGGSCSAVLPINGVGNTGAPQVEYPSSSPYVVAVGGTVLYTDGATPPKRSLEYAWTYTGGGSSIAEPEPASQKAIGTIVQPCAVTPSGGVPAVGTTCRGVPDVAALSGDIATNGYFIVNDGGDTQTGGTSLSSPLWAGMWARTLAAHPSTCTAFTAAQGQLGFGQDALYALAESSDTADAAAFFDVGNVDGTSLPTGNGQQVPLPRTALDPTGWDYVSGLGVPDLANIIKALDCDSVTPVAVNPTYPPDEKIIASAPTGACPANGTMTDPSGDTTVYAGVTPASTGGLDDLDLLTGALTANAAGITATATVTDLSSAGATDEIGFQWTFTYGTATYELLADDSSGTDTFTLEDSSFTSIGSLTGAFDVAGNAVSIVVPFAEFNTDAKPTKPLAAGATLSAIAVESTYSPVGLPVDDMAYGACTYEVQGAITTPPSTVPSPSPSASMSPSSASSSSAAPTHSASPSASKAPSSSAPKSPVVVATRPPAAPAAQAISFASCPRTFRPIKARKVTLACGVKPAAGVAVVVLQKAGDGTWTQITSAKTDRFGKFRVRLPAKVRTTLRLQVTGRTVYTFTLIPRIKALSFL